MTYRARREPRTRGTLLVAITTAALVLSVSIGGATAAVRPQTINLLEVTRSFTPIGGLDDTFHSVPKPGQGAVVASDLYRWNGPRRGAHYGTLQAVCTFTKFVGTTGWLYCNGAALLPAGEITISGITTQSDLFRIPIVGGTGAYVGARGYVSVRSINENNSADTFHITG